jgi:hypothetical protein
MNRRGGTTTGLDPFRRSVQPPQDLGLTADELAELASYNRRQACAYTLAMDDDETGVAAALALWRRQRALWFTALAARVEAIEAEYKSPTVISGDS